VLRAHSVKDKRYRSTQIIMIMIHAHADVHVRMCPCVNVVISKVHACLNVCAHIDV
jgi:hypothetical protein